MRERVSVLIVVSEGDGNSDHDADICECDDVDSRIGQLFDVDT